MDRRTVVAPGERPVPRLMISVAGAGRLPDVAERLAVAVAAGADAALVDDPGLSPAAVAALAAALRERVVGPVHLFVVNDLSLAVALGAGIYLPEGGVATAEARRRMGVTGFVARSVRSVAAAAASTGADLLIAEGAFAEPSAPQLGAGGLRRIVEAAWAPVLARGGVTPERLPAALAAGAEGVVLDGVLLADAHLEAVVSALAAALGDRAEPAVVADLGAVRVNGESVALEPETTVTDLLADLGKPDSAVVRVNGRRLARHRFAEVVLVGGDDVEIDG